MMTADAYTTIHVVGGLLPRGTLNRIATDGSGLPGRKPADYDLGPRQTIRTAADQAWADLTAAWTIFKKELEDTREDDPATGLTRDRWLKFLFQNLGYGTLQHHAVRSGITAGDTRYPVSHQYGHVPIHLVGANVDLDKRTRRVPGAAHKSPYSLVQELLNRSDDHLWGIVSNGRSLLLLRDSSSLVRQASIEFDLEGMFDGEVFSDFVVLYLVCHATRLIVRDEEADPASCWLERWRDEAIAGGTRAFGRFRDGVTKALQALGQGFVGHPDNRTLREDLSSGEISSQEYYRWLLRLVYRLVFCLVAEERGVLLDLDATAAGRRARERYREYYSMGRLRRLAARRHGTRHGDLWEALKQVFDGLGDDKGLPQLALPALNSSLFAPKTLEHLHECKLRNQDLLEAIRNLNRVPERSGLIMDVDYRNLDAEELGSVYESLLEMVPRYDPAAARFDLEELPGNERKTTGSYFTPPALVDCLLDSALDPLLDEAIRVGGKDLKEAALLGLTVCDPACGSGRFLVAAARRIARRLAMVRTDEVEPPESEIRRALRDVVARCIYGVDKNALAVELAKVSLWMEGVAPGKPLPYIEGRIKVGNALLGVTPRLLAEGVPDAAFKPLTGDDKQVARSLAKQNRAERELARHQAEQPGLSESETTASLETVIRVGNRQLSDQAAEVKRLADGTIASLRRQEAAWQELEHSRELEQARLPADAWCAAFVWPKQAGAPPPPTHWVLTQLQQDLDSLPDGDKRKKVLTATQGKVEELRKEYQFFHWHLEFPEVFRVPDAPTTAEHPEVGWSGGFSCVLGNPPWEHTELKEQEYFAARDPEVAAAAGKSRKRLIERLEVSNPELWAEFNEARRFSEGISHLARTSGRYPMCGRGRINTYALFAETDRSFLASRGRMGIVVPTGIGTDAATQYFFGDLVRKRVLVSFLDFENEAYLLSRAVHHSERFTLLSVAGRRVHMEETSFAFSVRYMKDLPARRFKMTSDEILLLNPNTGTCPVLRSRRDAEIVLGIYRHVPVLVRQGDLEDNPWSLSFMQGLFNMTTGSGLFRTRERLEGEGWRLEGSVFVQGSERYSPLYEAKMLHHFDHRLGTYEGQTEAQANVGTLPRLSLQQRDDPNFEVLPRYWVKSSDVEDKVPWDWRADWLLGFRDVCRSTDQRTLIAGIIPRFGVGHKLPLIFMPSFSPEVAGLLANLSTFVVDYIARQKLSGTSMSYTYLRQLPILPPRYYERSLWGDQKLLDFMVPRVVELVYTTWIMQPFAATLGYEGPPFRWDEERRAMLRAELDAAYFNLYGIWPENVEYIMDTFPVVERIDMNRYGEYRTKRLVLDTYDRMAEAITTGSPYRSLLDLPPGQGPRHPEVTTPQ